MQIFLDENKFGPGKIDGRLGQFTLKALAHYNYSIGVDAKDWSAVLKKSRKAIKTSFTNYTLKDDDYGFIGELSFQSPTCGARLAAPARNSVGNDSRLSSETPRARSPVAVSPTAQHRSGFGPLRAAPWLT